MPEDQDSNSENKTLIIIGQFLGLFALFSSIYNWLSGINNIQYRIILAIFLSLFFLVLFKIFITKIIPILKIYFKDIYHKIKNYLFPNNIVDVLDNMKLKLESIDNQLNLLAASSSAAKAFSLYDISNIYVIYTHRWDDKPENCLENSGDQSDNRKYVVPSIPIDEAYFLFSLMHWILSIPTINEKGIKCSCNLVSHETLINDELIKMNLAVVGINDVSRYLMKEMKNRGWNYYWYIDEKESKLINKVNNETLQSKRIADMNIGESAYCYGLISRTPNPINGDSYIILVTGSRREGQQVLTKWITQTNNLMKMIPNNADKYFQICIRGEFKKISDNEIEIENIKFKEITLTIN